MLKRNLVLGLAVSLMMAGSADAAGETSWVATSGGVGPLKIGMSVGTVEKALGSHIVLNFDAGGDEEACATTDVPGQQGLWMMFVHHRLASLTLRESSLIETPRGIGIGATEAQVRAAYMPLDITPRDYFDGDAPNRQMTYWTIPNMRGIRFLTDDTKKVDEIRVGDRSITWMEGCA